jgi:hypothetical protein
MLHRARTSTAIAYLNEQAAAQSMGLLPPEDNSWQPEADHDGGDNPHQSVCFEQIADTLFGQIMDEKGTEPNDDGSMATHSVSLSELLAQAPDEDWRRALTSAARLCGWPKVEIVAFTCAGLTAWAVMGSETDADGAPVRGHVYGDFSTSGAEADARILEMLRNEGLV